MGEGGVPCCRGIFLPAFSGAGVFVRTLKHMRMLSGGCQGCVAPALELVKMLQHLLDGFPTADFIQMI